jgi:hypothetical protein
MAGGYNPGDILIDDLTVNSPRSGSWQAAPNFLSGDVYETMFAPVVLASFEVLDDKDWLGQLQIAGDETVSFAYRTPSGTSCQYQFHLNSVHDVSVEGALKSKRYKIECITREAMHGQVNHVQKTYNTTIDNIVQDIIQTKLNTSLPVFTESTKGNQKKIIPNKPAMQAIEDLRKQAVSAQNKGSNYMFWRTWRGFYFQSLEYMLQQGDVKTFKQINTVGHKLGTTVDDNILAWEVKQNMDAVNRIQAGVMNNRVMTFDVHTHRFVSKDIKPMASELKLLGNFAITTLETFLNIFSNGFKPVMHTTHTNPVTKTGMTYQPDATPYKHLDLAAMQEQLMHMTVIGDPNLEPGKTHTANVNRVIGTTSSNQAEPQMSGRWLIAKTHHEIRGPEVRPRHVTNLECLKGAYQQESA